MVAKLLNNTPSEIIVEIGNSVEGLAALFGNTALTTTHFTRVSANGGVSWIDNTTAASSVRTIVRTAINDGLPVTIQLTANITVSNTTSTIIVRPKTNITLRSSNESERIISMSGARRTFEVRGRLTLSDNISLKRTGAGNKGAGVIVASGGHLIMESNALITGGIVEGYGGGVAVTGGVFTMNGGVISGNTVISGHGGGVAVMGSGEFIMNGGEISGNKVTQDGGYGGGVSVMDSGVFTMGGGLIADNSVKNHGGGVSVTGAGQLTINNGSIGAVGRQNSSSANDWVDNVNLGSGGGVSVLDNGQVVMNGGVIEFNNSIPQQAPFRGGGGVYLGGNRMEGGETPNFLMTGGRISRNNVLDANLGAWHGGGGVFVGGSSTFIMDSGDAQINKNTSAMEGGGVFISQNARYIMYAGHIFENHSGSDADGSNPDNVIEAVGGDGGGGVAIAGGIFETRNHPDTVGVVRTITGNSARWNGGGIAVRATNGLGNSEQSFNGPGRAIIAEGTLINGNFVEGRSDNLRAGMGGGVIVRDGAVMEMSGGIISGNTAELGGGVMALLDIFLDPNSGRKGGSIEMGGGVISRNTAELGGGIMLFQNGTFILSGGDITGNIAVGGNNEIYWETCTMNDSEDARVSSETNSKKI